MGCQQSRNTVPTECFDQEDQSIPYQDDDLKIKNLFQNIENFQKSNIPNEKVSPQLLLAPQTKGSKINNTNSKDFHSSIVSKKFNESRTLDLINNELFSHRNGQQSVRETKKVYGQDKENISVIKEYRKQKSKKYNNNFQSNVQQQNQQVRNSSQSSNLSITSALSSQLQMKFQSTFKDQQSQQYQKNGNIIQSQLDNIDFSIYNQRKFEQDKIQNNSDQQKQIVDSARQIMSIRAGKSIKTCEEEYDCILFMIFEKIIPQMEKYNSPLMAFKSEVQYLLEKWGEQVNFEVIQQTGEIRNFVSVRNTNDFIRITHELSCWRNFSLLEKFVVNVLKQQLNPQYLKMVKNNAQTIKALSCFIWIELSYQKDLNKLDVQIGVSERQPFHFKLLYQIITNKNERNNIIDWYNYAQPIANEYGYIVNSQHIDEIFDFYIFENDERTNLNSSIQAFYNYGAQFSPQLIQQLEQIPGNDFHILFHLNKFGLLNLKLSLQSVREDVEESIFEDISSNSQASENLNILRKVWKNLNNSIFHEENIYILHMIELNPDGYYLYKTREVSGDDDLSI